MKSAKIAYLAAISIVGSCLIIRCAYGDNFYVSATASNSIYKFDSNGNRTLFADASDGLDNPAGLAFDSSGNLYVANAGTFFGNWSIEKFNSSGKGSVFANTLLDQPLGLAFDVSNNLYVANFGTSDPGNVVKFNTNGIGSIFANGYSGLFTNGNFGVVLPVSLAFNSRGDLYVLNFDTSSIVKIDPNGVQSLFVGVNNGLNSPEGLAFDNQGNVYVSNYGNNTIMRYDTNGLASVFASVGLSGPAGLAFDSSGYLYVVNDSNGTIEKFDSDGNGTLFASGFGHGADIEIQVPEPATWRLLALASVFVGVCVSRYSKYAADLRAPLLLASCKI